MTGKRRTLGAATALDIGMVVEERQRVEQESLAVSVAVVLLGIGRGWAEVRCVGPEQWHGELADAHQGRVPVCPGGHPLVIVREGPSLELVWEGDES